MHERRPRWHARLGLTLLAGLSLLRPAPAEAADPRTKIMLNGEVVQVFFNDGDSFRVLSGDKKNAKVRVYGFNALESYGPIHQWGGWTAKELHVIAKLATLHARKGTWECETDGNIDSFGRMLVRCPGLAEDLIRRGMAHVMTTDRSPGDPTLVAAQKEAIEARRGIWAHGVPEYILTSLHSLGDAKSANSVLSLYNRLVSTEDGHSRLWLHEDEYGECEKVCWMNYEVDEAKVQQVFEWVRASKGFEDRIENLGEETLLQAIRDYAKYRVVVSVEDRRLAKSLTSLLSVYSRELGEDTAAPAVCMDYVPVRRRSGTGRAECLKT